MAKLFDPRKVLRQVSNALLKEFFSRRGELEEVPWEELKETHIGPIFDGWQALPDDDRNEVQVLLQDVNELADERGLSVLAEEIQWRAPQRLKEFGQWEGRMDRVMWAHLKMSEAFEEAAMFARADALAAGRFWVKRNSLPAGKISVDGKVRRTFENALSEHYWPTEMRGKYCAVEHYQRGNGAEYFFAYLDDYPDTHLVFDDTGQIERRADRYAFTNVFVFSPDEGALELFARGGQKAHLPLQQAFCRSVLGLDVGPADPLRPAYQLDHLLDPNFPLATDPSDRVAEARILRMRLEIRSEPLSYIELKADPKTPPDHIHTMIGLYLNGQTLPPQRVRVRQARFKLTFASDGNGRRPKTLSFTVSCPNSCDLKSRPDEVRAVGERCLKLWGIVVDE
jgi:hypothetical protein